MKEWQKLFLARSRCCCRRVTVALAGVAILRLLVFVAETKVVGHKSSLHFVSGRGDVFDRAAACQKADEFVEGL